MHPLDCQASMHINLCIYFEQTLDVQYFSNDFFLLKRKNLLNKIMLSRSNGCCHDAIFESLSTCTLLFNYQ